MKILYDRVVKLCNRHNIKLGALEKKLNFSDRSLSKWEDGDAWLSRVLKVAQYFDVSVDYLVGNTDDQQSHKPDTIKALESLKKIHSIAGETIQQLERQSAIDGK